MRGPCWSPCGEGLREHGGPGAVLVGNPGLPLLGGLYNGSWGAGPRHTQGQESRSPTSQPARAWPGGLSGHLGWPGPSFNQSTRAKWVSRQTDRPAHRRGAQGPRPLGPLSSPATVQRPLPGHRSSLPHSAPHQAHLLDLPKIWGAGGCIFSSFESSIKSQPVGTTGAPQGDEDTPPSPTRLCSRPRGPRECGLEGAAG